MPGVLAALGRAVPTESADLTAANCFWAIEAGTPSTMMLRFAVGHGTDGDGKIAKVKIYGCSPESPELPVEDSSALGVWTAQWMGTLTLTGGTASVHASSRMRPASSVPTSFKWVDTIAVTAEGALEPGVRLMHYDITGTGAESANGIVNAQFDRTGYRYILVAGWLDTATGVGCQYAHLGG